MRISKEQFNNAKQNFSEKSLSNTQKQNMLQSIYSEETVQADPVLSPLSSYLMFFKEKYFVAIAVVVLLLSGTSFASAYSLPGDMLYSIKTKILEPVGLSLKFSEEAENRYKIQLLEKRVEELEKLKERDFLSKEKQKESRDTASKNVKDLESSAIFNEDGKNSEVSSQIEIYNNIIETELEIQTNIINKNENKVESKSDIQSKIEEKVDSIKQEKDIYNKTNIDSGDILKEQKNKIIENIKVDINQEIDIEILEL